MNKILLIVYFFAFSIATKAQTADFIYQSSNGVFCDPSKVHFSEKASGSPTGFIWSFGNGESSNEANPDITYQDAGTYTVKLIVIYPDTTATISRSLIINTAIHSTIGYDKNYICKPGIINFTATSSGNNPGFEWNFGDASPIQSINNNNIRHNFSDTGVYHVLLTAKDVSGCFDTNQAIITVKVPALKGVVLPKAGCVPESVAFTVSAVAPADISGATYSWNFGDRSPLITTTIAGTNHLYTVAGEYFPTVTVTTGEGCTNVNRFNKIAFGAVPVNNSAYAIQNNICASDSAVFISKATNANSYRWNFGDSKTVIANDTIVRHKYGALGIKTVTVTPAFNGCYGKTDTFQIKVIGVIAAYKYVNSCNSKNTFALSNASRGNVSVASWNFGDGTAGENTLDVLHSYSSPGSYLTTFVVTDNITGCSDAYSRMIYNATPFLLNADTSVCKNSNSIFSVINDYNNPAETYTWHVAGMEQGPVSDSSISIDVTAFGAFDNYVVLNNGTSYCQDTVALSHPFLVKGPNLSFTLPSSTCVSATVSITNTSEPVTPTDFINSWHWDFGNNTEVDTSYQPHSYLYDSSGIYTVHLAAIDINGCKDTLVKTITVEQTPFVYARQGLEGMCAGKIDTLIAFHSDSIFWSPSNSLSCATCDTVVSTANVTTKYFVKATGKSGCTAMDSVTVKVISSPLIAVPLVSDLYICLHDTVRINVEPPAQKITWSPATSLSHEDEYGPLASPNQSTVYTATLTDSLGCFPAAPPSMYILKVRRVWMQERIKNFCLTQAFQ